MKETDFLQQYIDAAKESTNRTRQILLVMIIASILMFAAFWNSREGGWVNNRLALAKATVDVLNNEESQRTVGSSPWQIDDFVNAVGLCSRLKDGKDPLSDYLRTQFTPNTRKLLASYKPPQQPSKELLEAVVFEFNRLRKTPSLYEWDRFIQVPLTEETKTLLSPELEGKDLLRKNRLLLENAFHEIASSNEKSIVPFGEEELYKQAKEYAHKKPARSLLQAETSLHWLQQIRSEQVSQINVPVLGISFDINDLGILGGFTFMVLLVWVNYSVWHQSTNLDLAFDFAKQLEKKGEAGLLYHTYQNLAMRQVLTIPPKPASIRSSKEDRLKIWIQKVSKLLYALPLTVQAIVVAHDWDTLDLGRLTNPSSTNIVLITEALFLALILVLTLTCFYMWRRTYNTWKTVAEEI